MCICIYRCFRVSFKDTIYIFHYEILLNYYQDTDVCVRYSSVHRDSDNYFWQICSLGQWQSRRKKQKGNTELHTAFFQNHNFVWSLPRNIGHRPSKCQELNKFYIFTYLCYWFLLFMLFSNISWPDLTKRTRSLTGSQHDSRKISELFHIIIRWVTLCTKWQFRTEYNFGGKLQTAIW